MTDPNAAQFPALFMVGLNHRTAPVEVREAIAFNHAQTLTALAEFRARMPRMEAVLLSTCNRVELYAAGPADNSTTCPALPSTTVPCNAGDLIEFIADQHKLSPQNFSGHTYEFAGAQAVDHLFSVAGSLDSMVLGETQILAQVKQAYQWAMDAGSVGPILHGLFQRALAAAKDVHEQTELSGGRVSIASVAVDLLHEVFDRFDDKVVLVIGAGKMAELMLRQIRTVQPGRIVVTNRSVESGRSLADKYSLELSDFAQLNDLLVQADIVLTGTGSHDPIITTAQIKGLMRQRQYRPLVMVDIAVPRDVEQGVSRIANVYLYNIDDLELTAQANRARRGDQVAQSRELINRHVQNFMQWAGTRSAGPVVRALYSHFRTMGGHEVDELFAAHPNLSEAQREAIRKMTHRLIGKILHAPVSQLTSPEHAQGTHETMHLARAIVQLFQLSPPPPHPPATDTTDLTPPPPPTDDA